jgi:LmbE family N-acetylglucosaminyl deacetylase
MTETPSSRRGGGLLLLLAHPDDESFFAAGAAARYSDAGIPVGLVCATRGQAGSTGEPPLVSRDELPAERERELRAACAILGIELLALLDYRDRELAAAPGDEIRRALVAAIRAERPRVVGTFDPNGVNGHADHIAISRFAHDAVAAAADPRWWPELGPAHAVPRVVWTTPVEPWVEWRPDALARHAGVDYVVDVARWHDRKGAALRAHRTQHQGIERYWFGAHGDAVRSTECFRHGLGARPDALPADDLFHGLDEGSAGS